MTKTRLETPKHVGIILDGNRRWAKQNGLSALDGHRRGAEVFKDISLFAFDRGVQYLSAFIFSTENWSRTDEEVTYLMKLIVKAVERYLDEFNKQSIKIIIIGQHDNLSKSVLNSIKKTQEQTKNNKKGTLVLCLGYGGQQEILDTVKKIINKNYPVEEITKELFEHNLYSPEIPPIDLLIRTSGEKRISGFMLWRIAYAELLFSDKLWPDYSKNDFNKALNEYKIRQRRFGG